MRREKYRRIFLKKGLTCIKNVIEFIRILQSDTKKKQFGSLEREGDSGSPSVERTAGHFRAARDDRDGCSRYRAS